MSTIRIPALIASKEMTRKDLIQIYESIVNFFNEYGFNILPYMFITREGGEDNCEILSINLCTAMNNILPQIAIKMKIRKNFSSEKRVALANLLWERFIQPNENVENKALSFKTFVGGEEGDEYLRICHGKFLKATNERPLVEGIEGQFMGTVSNYRPFGIQLITDFQYYCLKEHDGISAIQNLWNKLENGEINEYHANLLLPWFVNIPPSSHNPNKLHYGKCDDIIDNAVAKMREGGEVPQTV